MNLKIAALCLLVAACSKKPPPETTIKLGQTMPYSGPASAYGVIGKVHSAYFKMLNEHGGVHGHKVELLSLDDAYNPSKAVEQTRKLVESDGVLAMFGTIGTPANVAVRDYLNQKKIPQIFIGSGSDIWTPAAHPWSVPWPPSYRAEAKVYASYVLSHNPNAKMCVLYQNDDFGKDYLSGLKDGFGAEHDKIVVKTISYEVTDPTIDSQIVSLQGAGCDTLLLATTQKFSAQAIRKTFDIGWKPTEFLSSTSVSMTAVIKPAGLDKSKGVITGQYMKDPGDPKLAADPELADYRAFMTQYLPDIDLNDYAAVYGYGMALALTKVLEQCGEDFSRENLMKQVLSLSNLRIPVLLPGITVSTSPTDYHPMSQFQLARFNGTTFEGFGDVLSAD